MMSDLKFWDFSLGLYGRPEVPPAALRLQDRDGLDVNLVLWGIWLGRIGAAPLDEIFAASAVAQVAPWRDMVVRALRTIRQTMKPGIPHAPAAEANELREKIKKLELDGERIQHAILEAMARPGPAQADKLIAVHNVAQICAVEGVTIGDAVKADIELLVGAAFAK